MSDENNSKNVKNKSYPMHTGQNAISNKKSQTNGQFSPTADIKKLKKSLLAFEQELVKLDLPEEDKEIIIDFMGSALREAGNEEPTLLNIKMIVYEVIRILKDSGMTIEKIAELYYGSWFGISDGNSFVNIEDKNSEIKDKMFKENDSEGVKEKGSEGKIIGGTGIIAGDNVTIGDVSGQFAAGENISPFQSTSFLLGEPLVDLKVKYRCQNHGFFIPRKINWKGMKPYCPECNKPLEVKSSTQEV